MTIAANRPTWITRFPFLVLAISAGFSAPHGSKRRSALPGLAVSGAALAFRAPSR